MGDGLNLGQLEITGICQKEDHFRLQRQGALQGIGMVGAALGAKRFEKGCHALLVVRARRGKSRSAVEMHRLRGAIVDDHLKACVRRQPLQTCEKLPFGDFKGTVKSHARGMIDHINDTGGLRADGKETWSGRGCGFARSRVSTGRAIGIAGVFLFLAGV